MAEPSSSIKTSTVLLISAGTIVSGILAYAAYFDHRRQTDPDFRKALRRDARRQARAAQEEADAQGAQERQAIREAVEQAQEGGFPTAMEEQETMFMQEVGRGESLLNDESRRVDAAACFYRALKVYPSPRDLIGIYEKTVPSPVINILAEMIAMDPAMQVAMGGQMFGSRPEDESAI